ncbi:LysR family transcriptional regulator [Francisella salina]|uniref:LysR family transcriptional regulator n=1 Tax=Francisella salina TaxID=573569 RepID=A0ABM5MC68_FRAST|nr:LysR family transcriptional regulator [Francisella salina]AEI36811.1 putative LysR family transcriptional regulator [Francisella salina]
MSLEILDKSIIEAIRYFVSVVELGTLTAVKDLYRIEVNTLKSKLKQLENYIGVNLLVNNKNRISITNSGIVFYQKCNKILFDLETTVVNVRNNGVHFVKSLNVIGNSIFIDLFISEILPGLGEYKDKYTFNLDTYILNQYQYINQLGNYDIALINSDCIDKIDQNKWVICNHLEYIDKSISKVYVSKAFFKQNPLSSLEKILEAPFIVKKDNLEAIRISYDKEGVQKNDIMLKNIKFVVEDGKTKFRLIEEGLGIGVLDSFELATSKLRGMNIKPIDGVHSKVQLKAQYVIVSKYLPSNLIDKIRKNIDFLLKKTGMDKRSL